MANTSTTLPPPGGILRFNWVQDQLAHVLDHSTTDETSGTWTGLAGPRYGLALGADVDNAILRRLAAHGDIADLVWEALPDLADLHGQLFQAAIYAHQNGDAKQGGRLWEQLQAVWSHAWAQNYATLELMQNAGLTRFSAVKPQRWVIASFEHHSGPHGALHPHVHNIVITALTTAAAAT
jgi:hypothetical protein